jgi:hypothetical protein
MIIKTLAIICSYKKIALYTKKLRKSPLSCHSKLLQLSLNLNKPLLLSQQLLPFPPHDLILLQIKRTFFRPLNRSDFELLNKITLYVLCDRFDEFKVDNGGDVVDNSLKKINKIKKSAEALSEK